MASVATIALVSTIASTAVSFIGGMQQSSALEAQAQQQRQQAEYQAQVATAQAKYQRDVAERNAKAIEQQAAYSARAKERQAVQEEASAQRKALEAKRLSDIKISNAQARMAASGGGTFDPTSLDTVSRLGVEGEYDVLGALYEGKVASSLLNTQADLDLYEGTTQAMLARSEADMSYNLGLYDAQNVRYAGDVASYKTKQKASSAKTGAAMSLVSGAQPISSAYDIYKKAGT